MKKKLTSMVLSIGIMASTVAGITTVYADDNISVELNGQKLQFEVQPQIIDDYTMVPMRTIFEALGYEIMWNQEQQSIMAVNHTSDALIFLIIGNPYMIVSPYSESIKTSDKNYAANHLKTLDKAPIIIDGNTLVPVRAISEASGCNVQWNGDTKTVSITNLNSYTYYPNTSIPTYDSITGQKFIRQSGITYGYSFDSNSMNIYVSYLRQKLGYSVVAVSDGIYLLSPDSKNCVNVDTYTSSSGEKNTLISITSL